ncbi:MAG: 2-oxo-4-hydroxy-4-carboxy-5-ureidoimidazoline decarboxylase [Polyangiaceae bacterium]
MRRDALGGASAGRGGRPLGSRVALCRCRARLRRARSRRLGRGLRAHPRIGEKKAAVATGARAASWAGGEQAKVDAASDAAKAELVTINQAYEARFGFLYIVCATGKTADEMIAIAKERMTHTPEQEIRVASGEQRKITQLRLEKLALLR